MEILLADIAARTLRLGAWVWFGDIVDAVEDAAGAVGDAVADAVEDAYVNA